MVSPKNALSAAILAGALTLPLLAGTARAAATPNPQPPPAPACTAGDPTTIWADSGKTTAALCGTGNAAAGVTTYTGIPYVAQQPSSATRWTDTTPASWPPSPALQAVNVQNQCPQAIPAWNTSPPPTGENCLYLNVWAPTATLNTPSAKLPVMVFIHGGAFVLGSGSGPLYNGTALAQNGVIVVTLNYRLGALGFMGAANVPSGGSSPASNLLGNFGLNDQRNALQWVQNSIAAFGGDPAQVTLFGESAGAMSTGLHLFAAPHSAPLFQAAIMESNPLGSQYRTLAQTQAQGANFIAKLCRDWYTGKGACPGTMAWLQSLTTTQILSSQASFLNLGIGAGSQTVATTAASGVAATSGNVADSLPWSPTVDGSTVIAQPLAGFATGMPQKPFAFGVNADEGAIFAAMIANANFQKTKGLIPLLPADYAAILAIAIPDATARATITSYTDRLAQQPYSAPAANPPSYYGTSATTNGTAQTINNLIDDFAFHCANLWTAAQSYGQIANHAATPAYGYLFAQQPIFDLYKDSTGTPIPACAPANGNVCHANELPYVFSSLTALVTTPPTADATLAATMTTNWANFAKNPASASGLTAYTPTGNLTLFNSAVAATSSTISVSELDAAGNCSALWNTLGLYPKAVTPAKTAAK